MSGWRWRSPPRRSAGSSGARLGRSAPTQGGGGFKLWRLRSGSIYVRSMLWQEGCEMRTRWQRTGFLHRVAKFGDDLVWYLNPTANRFFVNGMGHPWIPLHLSNDIIAKTPLFSRDCEVVVHFASFWSDRIDKIVPRPIDTDVKESAFDALLREWRQNHSPGDPSMCPSCHDRRREKGRGLDGRRAYRCRVCRTVWEYPGGTRQPKYSPQRKCYQFASSGAGYAAFASLDGCYISGQHATAHIERTLPLCAGSEIVLSFRGNLKGDSAYVRT